MSVWGQVTTSTFSSEPAQLKPQPTTIRDLQPGHPLEGGRILPIFNAVWHVRTPDFGPPIVPTAANRPEHSRSTRRAEKSGRRFSPLRSAPRSGSLERASWPGELEPPVAQKMEFDMFCIKLVYAEGLRVNQDLQFKIWCFRDSSSLIP